MTSSSAAPASNQGRRRYDHTDDALLQWARKLPRGSPTNVVCLRSGDTDRFVWTRPCARALSVVAASPACYPDCRGAAPCVAERLYLIWVNDAIVRLHLLFDIKTLRVAASALPGYSAVVARFNL